MTTGPDVNDPDDDNDTRDDLDFDHLEEGFTADPCYQGAQSSDWDNDNDCVLDEDDKALTFITLDLPGNLWLDARSPAIFSGLVEWINPISGLRENASGLPVQIHIEWANNGTTAVETTNILSDQMDDSLLDNSSIGTSSSVTTRPTRSTLCNGDVRFQWSNILRLPRRCRSKHDNRSKQQQLGLLP